MTSIHCIPPLSPTQSTTPQTHSFSPTQNLSTSLYCCSFRFQRLSFRSILYASLRRMRIRWRRYRYSPYVSNLLAIMTLPSPLLRFTVTCLHWTFFAKSFPVPVLKLLMSIRDTFNIWNYDRWTAPPAESVLCWRSPSSLLYLLPSARRNNSQELFLF